MAIVTMTVACKSVSQNKVTVGCKQTIHQGLQGQVVFKSGNLMPGPDMPESAGARPVAREVHIYELTNTRQVKSEDNQFYSNITTQLVKKVQSDETGCFQAVLAPGQYSVFVLEKELLYANLFDGQGNIFPVTVKEGQVTSIEFEITYDATF